MALDPMAGRGTPCGREPPDHLPVPLFPVTPLRKKVRSGRDSESRLLGFRGGLSLLVPEGLSLCPLDESGQIALGNHVVAPNL